METSNKTIKEGLGQPGAWQESGDEHFVVTREELVASLNEFLGNTAAKVILNYIFPKGFSGEKLTPDEFSRLKEEFRELLGSQGELIVSLFEK